MKKNNDLFFPMQRDLGHGNVDKQTRINVDETQPIAVHKTPQPGLRAWLNSQYFLDNSKMP